MRLLILGGTIFLGRHVAAEALQRGHDVTLFHRGLNGADLFPDAEHVLGDRTGDLAHLVFVSTCNVYPAWPAEPVDEDSPVWTEGDDYGPKKAASERAADAAMAGRVASVRAGLLCGPYDNIFRLPWWVRRIAAGGDVVAPGDPARTVQLIDARDLAAWMLDLAERRVAGAFNGTAPARQSTMRDVLESAVEATGSGARLHWVPDEVLAAHDVAAWDELPLWFPADAGAGTWEIGTERARAAGLRCRPVAETVTDTWAWLCNGGEAALTSWRAEMRPRGLSAERERELLAAV